MRFQPVTRAKLEVIHGLRRRELAMAFSAAARRTAVQRMAPAAIALSTMLLGMAGCASLPQGDQSIAFYDSADQMPQGCKSLGPVSAAGEHIHIAPERFVKRDLISNAIKRYGTLTDTILMLSSTSATIGTVEATGQAFSCDVGQKG